MSPGDQLSTVALFEFHFILLITLCLPAFSLLPLIVGIMQIVVMLRQAAINLQVLCVDQHEHEFHRISTSSGTLHGHRLARGAIVVTREG